MIDDTASRHTVETLRRWKTQHEEWIFQRVASADSLLKHGLTSISIENIGPFQARTTIPLGRHNVVFGQNNSGKSSLCECIAAFSGGTNFENFRKRWNLFGARSPNMTIEGAMSVHSVRTAVRLSEEATTLKHTLDADVAMKAKVEAIRLKAGPLMNLGDVIEKSVPKMMLVAAPSQGGRSRFVR